MGRILPLGYGAVLLLGCYVVPLLGYCVERDLGFYAAPALTIGDVRRGFIEAVVLEQGYQASEVASFLGCHASNVSRALQKRENNFEQDSQV